MKLPLVTLKQLQDAIEALLRYSDVQKESFMADKMLQDAVNFQLTILGEAVRRLPSDLRDAHPDIPWQNIINTRNYVVHEYDSGDLELL